MQTSVKNTAAVNGVIIFSLLKALRVKQLHKQFDWNNVLSALMPTVRLRRVEAMRVCLGTSPL